MVAVTESASDITEFSGDYKVAIVKVDGAASTAGLTLTIEEFTGKDIIGVFCSHAGTPTATCLVMAPTDVTDNIVTLQIYDAAGTIATGTVTDFYVMVIGR